jgi:Flp pilus assembly protein TadD
MRRLLLTTIAIPAAAATALANDEQDCFQGKDPRLRIKVCSEIIRRAPHDATAYHHRAVSHAMAGDIDSAIRDYTTVIEIAPNNASAFDNRGRAYASKGDYAQATADLTRASELMAKANAQPTTIAPTTSQAAKRAAIARTAGVPKTKPKTTGDAGTSWWTWLWGNGPNQASGKNSKP